MDAKWHNKQCFLGESIEYGVHKLPLYTQELISNALVKWHNIGNEIVGVSKEEAPRRCQRFIS